MTRMEPKQWLLGTGEVATEPPLEMTSSGRKVRVAGTKTSVFNNDLDNLLATAVKQIADDKKTHVWLDLSHLSDRVNAHLGFDPASTRCKLHLVHDPSNTSGQTTCWWRFKDPHTPFEVYVTARMVAASRHGSVNAQNLWVHAAVPHRTYYDDATTDINNVDNAAFSQVVGYTTRLSPDTMYKWQEFIRDNPAPWSDVLQSAKIHQHARAGVTEFLKVVRMMEDLDSIQVPDYSDPYNPSWRTLELYGTNVNAELVNDLTEYLDGAPTIEQAAELYQQMLDTLRSVGIAVSGKAANDFMAALLAGEKSTLNMQVFNLAEEHQQVDNDHKLSVHLPTGTFIVECSHQEVDKNKVAEKWEEERMIAQLTGEEPTLLAYARAYASNNTTRRTKGILNERQSS